MQKRNNLILLILLVLLLPLISSTNNMILVAHSSTEKPVTIDEVRTFRKSNMETLTKISNEIYKESAIKDSN